MDLDEFSDNGLDDLPQDALEEIENQAIIQLTQGRGAQLTQQQQQQHHHHHHHHHHQHHQHHHHQAKSSSIDAAHAAQQSNDYGWDEDDDLDTAQVVNDAGVPVRSRRGGVVGVEPGFPKAQTTPTNNMPRRIVPPVPNPRWNPALVQIAARSNQSVVQTLPPPSSLVAVSQQRLNPSQPSQAPRQVPHRFNNPSQASQTFRQLPPLTQSQPGDLLSALQTRVRVLEHDLSAARGEASIIRANSVKAQREFDAQLARMKKAHAEELEKKNRKVDAAVAAEKSVNTELQFLQQDIKVVSDRAKRKEAASTGNNVVTTPKKAGGRSWDMADGFDEMDRLISPSKGHGRGRNTGGSVAFNVGERTPTKGKRKRPVMDSPVAPLEIDTTTDIIMIDDEQDAPSHSSPKQTPPVAAPTGPYEFLQLILDHGSFNQQPPTFDFLSRFSFPSDTTSASLASTIFGRLPLMGDAHRSMQLHVDFAEIIISLWSRCLEEEYWEPIKHLMPLLSFTFWLHATSVAPFVARRLVPTAQLTICVVADALQSRTPDGNLAHQQEYKYFADNIDTVEAMSLLHMCALACAASQQDAQDGMDHHLLSFWKLLSLDTIILMLSPKQRFHDIVNMLNLLSLSSLPASIGPVTEDKDPQLVARIVIERVSARLIEHARSPLTPGQRRTMRATALGTLIAFARHPYGALQLAVHDTALPRIMTCLSISIDELYDQPVSCALLPEPPLLVTADDDDDDDDDDAVLATTTSQGISRNKKLTDGSSCTMDLSRIISQCVLLIHALVTDPHTADAADLSQKLSVFHGGSQRQLLALGRLTFAEEDLVLEAGIDGTVIEAAHELLELAVSPDEGEVVSEAFGP